LRQPETDNNATEPQRRLRKSHVTQLNAHG